MRKTEAALRSGSAVASQDAAGSGIPALASASSVATDEATLENQPVDAAQAAASAHTGLSAQKVPAADTAPAAHKTPAAHTAPAAQNTASAQNTHGQQRHPVHVVVLAAGQGKRMHAALPKVLHRLGGKTLLAHVLDSVVELAATRPAAVQRLPLVQALPLAPQVDTLHLVVGFASGQVRHAVEASDLATRFARATASAAPHSAPTEGRIAPAGLPPVTTMHSLPADRICWHLQHEQRGTGHALMQAAGAIPRTGHTLVLFGDVPLIQARSLRALIDHLHSEDASVILTARRSDPFGYGRILRNPQGAVLGIVEERDASPEQKQIGEINSGVMLLPNRHLHRWLTEITCDNAQGEYYLTDVVALAHRDGLPLIGHCIDDTHQIEGVNTLGQLIALERIFQRRLAEQLLAEGVCVMDPARLDVRGRLRCGRGVRIDVNCVFEGEVDLGDGVSVGAHCVLIDTGVAQGAQVLPFTHCEGAQIGADSRVGPYARLRPGTVLGVDNHVGNFVEIKATRTGAHSKANHLAYLGDAVIGERVNVGAGTITCNYDGANKHQTIIEDDAFIGSDTQLVAPVRVGAGATLGAGTTLTRNAPAGQLTVSRAPQHSVAGWKRPRKRNPPAAG